MFKLYSVRLECCVLMDDRTLAKGKDTHREQAHVYPVQRLIDGA